MFIYEKKLQYPINIKTPNARLAKIIITQYGGPDGELGASLRYLSQRFSMPYPELKGLLTDIGTEERLCSPTSTARQSPSRSSMYVHLDGRKFSSTSTLPSRYTVI